jgi:hypothetical protein
MLAKIEGKKIKNRFDDLQNFTKFEISMILVIHIRPI